MKKSRKVAPVMVNGHDLINLHNNILPRTVQLLPENMGMGPTDLSSYKEQATRDLCRTIDFIADVNKISIQGLRQIHDNYIR